MFRRLNNPQSTTMVKGFEEMLDLSMREPVAAMSLFSSQSSSNSMRELGTTAPSTLLNTPNTWHARQYSHEHLTAALPCSLLTRPRCKADTTCAVVYPTRKLPCC